MSFHFSHREIDILSWRKVVPSKRSGACGSWRSLLVTLKLWTNLSFSIQIITKFCRNDFLLLNYINKKRKQNWNFDTINLGFYQFLDNAILNNLLYFDLSNLALFCASLLLGHPVYCSNDKVQEKRYKQVISSILLNKIPKINFLEIVYHEKSKKKFV